MQQRSSLGCVIMASGLSRRFGSNKLLVPFCGEPMLCRAIAAADTPLLAARIVVTRSAEVAALCRQQNVPFLLHTLPGRNDTVRLGLSALMQQMPDLAGCVFLPGDQPLLRRETLETLIHAFDAQKETERVIFRSGFRAEDDPAPLVGSPVLFSSGFFPELCALPEGKGGNVLLKKYPEKVHIVYAAHREELADADTPEALACLEALAQMQH